MADARDSTPLARLIDQAMQEQGLSYEDISRRSGNDSAGQRAFNLRKDPPPMPKVETIRSVALGLSVSEWRLWEALGQSLGLPAPQPGGNDFERRARDPLFEHLDPEDTAAVIALVRRLAEARRDLGQRQAS